jgi:type II secretory pathway pseudopilin PulG
MKKENGFSLLELLIIVAILMILAMIAVPSLFRSRQAANESSAVANLRTVSTAEISYSLTNAGRFASVDQLITAGLLDSRYVSTMSGYNIVIEVSPDTLDFTATATARADNEGRFDYFTRPDYVIRYSTAPGRAPVGFTGEPVH